MTIYAHSVTAVGVQEGKVSGVGPVTVQALVSSDTINAPTTVEFRVAGLVTDSDLYLRRADINESVSPGDGHKSVFATFDNLPQFQATFDAAATNGGGHTDTVYSNVLVT